MNLCDYADTQFRSDTQAKLPFHRLEKESSLQSFSVLASDPWDYQPIFYQSRRGDLINKPDLYHAQNYATTVHDSIVKASIPSSVHDSLHLPQGSSVKTVTAKLNQGPQVTQTFQAYSSTRYQHSVQVVPSVRKSAPFRFVQSDSCVKSLSQTGSNAANQEARTQERIPVKEEELSCAYLEDGK